jgi:hypothetical protein
MLHFGVTIPATVPQRSEIPEGLTNYSVLENWNTYCMFGYSSSFIFTDVYLRLLGLTEDSIKLTVFM